MLTPAVLTDLAMAQTHRFQAALRRTVDRTAKEEFMRVTMEELGHQQITFGKEKKGLRYSEVVRDDPRYVAWFTSTYKNSDKTPHQKFIRYVQLYTEDLERRNKSDSTGTNTATPGAMSKSKAAPKTAAYPEPKEKMPVSSPCTTPRSEAWEMLKEETAHQNDRISNIRQTHRFSGSLRR